MTVNRRQFLKVVTTGAALAATATGAAAEVKAFQRAVKPRMPEALVGLLYNSTLCIGCRACVAACKQANATSADISRDQTDGGTGTGDTAKDLTGWPLNWTH